MQTSILLTDEDVQKLDNFIKKVERHFQQEEPNKKTYYEQIEKRTRENENRDYSDVIKSLSLDYPENSLEHIWDAYLVCVASSGHRSIGNSMFDRLRKEVNLSDIKNKAVLKQLEDKKVPYKKTIKNGYKVFIRKKSRNNLLKVLIDLRDIENKTLNEERRLVKQLLEILKGCGIGLKQSRNLLRTLGLVKYLVPLDSRVMYVLSQLYVDFWLFKVDRKSLQDPVIYEQIEDILNAFATKLKISPCMLDAYLFFGADLL